MAVTLTTRDGGYPSLETVAQVVRIALNDWQSGLLGTPLEGKITTDSALNSPQTLPAMMSALREVYRELRNAGAPRLLRDNVQVTLPPNSVTGPNIQTYLAFNGYFDGGVLQPSPVLPADMLWPVRLWEQQTGNQLPFVPMTQPQFGLNSRNQTFALGEWEWREDQLNFVGALCPITIRMRYYASLAQFSPPQAIITGWTSSGAVVTFQCLNSFTAGQSLYLSGFASATSLNKTTITVQNPTSISFQATIPGLTVNPDQGYALPVLNYSFLYSTTFIPILDCEEAVAYKTAAFIGGALSGETPSVMNLRTKATDAMFQLRNAISRRNQSVDYQREPYTGGAPDSWPRGNDNTLI